MEKEQEKEQERSQLVPSLDAMTQATVEELYGITDATPDAQPTFIFLVGAPGSGKSSGHRLLPLDGKYATINMDILLESLAPFRSASAMAYRLRHNELTAPLFRKPGTMEPAKPQKIYKNGKVGKLHEPKPTPAAVSFATIAAYGSKLSNLGLFEWYDEAHGKLAAVDPDTIHAFNSIARPPSIPVGHSIITLTDAALKSAIDKRVNIVYETTLSVAAGVGKRVKKVDNLMEMLGKKGYSVAMYHIIADPGIVSARLKARQNDTMKGASPFYRYVPSSLEAVKRAINDTKEGYDLACDQYKGIIECTEQAPLKIRIPLSRESSAKSIKSSAKSRKSSAKSRKSSAKSRKSPARSSARSPAKSPAKSSAKLTRTTPAP